MVKWKDKMLWYIKTGFFLDQTSKINRILFLVGIFVIVPSVVVSSALQKLIFKSNAHKQIATYGFGCRIHGFKYVKLTIFHIP
jgi:hypothetical protein